MRQSMILAILSICCSTLCAGGTKQLDYIGLHYAPGILAKIEQFMPPDIAQNLLEDNIPANELWSFICAKEYIRNTGDSTSDILLLFYSDGLSKGVLRAVSGALGNSTVYGEISDLMPQAPIDIILADIDCDQVNEILPNSSVGATGYQQYDIIKFGTGGMKRLTERTGVNVIVGRMFEIDSTANKCPRQIRISYDGPVKYRPDTVRTFQFDVAKQSYQLESVKALPKTGVIND